VISMQSKSQAPSLFASAPENMSLPHTIQGR
jgi:hypothetical protein